MILSQMTWQEVDACDREVVTLIPTGSLEQHGPHLPLFTDTLLASAVAAAVEQNLPSKVLLTPALWLGASGHHLKFPGSLSASFDGYMAAVESVAESLMPHGFRKFYVINGHGGNTEPNGMVMRKLKAKYPDAQFGHLGYFAPIPEAIAKALEGPAKDMRHACEAETSLIMHLHPELVRKDRIRDDGLLPNPPIKGAVLHFDEMTEQGSFGYATFAKPEKGKAIFEAAVKAMTQEIDIFFEGYVLEQP